VEKMIVEELKEITQLPSISGYEDRVKVLDFAVFKKHFSVLNNKYIATRSLDDRFGVVALMFQVEQWR